MTPAPPPYRLAVTTSDGELYRPEVVTAAGSKVWRGDYTPDPLAAATVGGTAVRRIKAAGLGGVALLDDEHLLVIGTPHGVRLCRDALVINVPAPRGANGYAAAAAVGAGLSRAGFEPIAFRAAAGQFAVAVRPNVIDDLDDLLEDIADQFELDYYLYQSFSGGVRIWGDPPPGVTVAKNWCPLTGATA